MGISLSGEQLQDKVTMICNDLYSKGQKVSVRIVLSMLPDVSSTSTVHKYYKTWKDELEANQKSLLEKMGFSEEFTRVFMTEITRHATEAERRYRDMADDAKEQSQQAIDDLERAEDRLYKQTALLEQREKQIKNLEAELAQTENAQLAITQELRQQIESLTDQLNESTVSNERLRTELAKNEIKLESNALIVEESKNKNTELNEQVKSLNDKVIAQAQELTRFESKQESQELLLSELRETKAALQMANSHLDNELRQLQQERHTLNSHLNDAKSNGVTLSNRLEQASEQIAELKAQLHQNDEMIKRYETLLKNE
ncbi:DNA-binding protein [Photobacterium damselae]|uniref:Mfp1 (Mar binding filament-like protein 1) n=5 Tax=Photobacterium damselae TaxID=38293 RepID=D0Z592_PHODD|nr:DNA-binding protein [Photobacterium damselae]EEZ39066.1 mfp1 (mar binding filament-like protein 1) [Photobacterium damselae subsp. damselae CIP 102761]EEZ39126.1 mfp1 (mar binding filament-like protein 1) [Photobacterium damselae subsp. damselae CIP 102761]NVO72884.1 DNA-binding protein [Photobacterium damselae subsp. damselae]QSH59597.1 DNA-binding protein [Photobacterium damselae subsp. damselae]CBX86833.1 Chromosome segregation ATPase, sms [Photobacterium damselae subsp. damselae]